jgi:hypothetical protein
MKNHLRMMNGSRSNEYVLRSDRSLKGDVAHAKIPIPVVMIPSIKKITDETGDSTFNFF